VYEVLILDKTGDSVSCAENVRPSRVQFVIDHMISVHGRLILKGEYHIEIRNQKGS